MKRLLVLFLAIVMLTATVIPAFAAVPEDNVVSPQYAYIKSCKASLSINEDTGVATCNSYCYAASGYTVKIQCKLQQYTGNTWSTLKTWSVSGPYYANVNENWTVTGGFTYRVYCLFSIYNSAGALVETGTTTNSYVFPKN